MNAKTIVSAFALLALCFVPAASFAKALTPDYENSHPNAYYKYNASLSNATTPKPEYAIQKTGKLNPNAGKIVITYKGNSYKILDCVRTEKKDNWGQEIQLCGSQDEAQREAAQKMGRDNEVASCMYHLNDNGKSTFYNTHFVEGDKKSVEFSCPKHDLTFGKKATRISSSHSHPAEDSTKGHMPWFSDQDIISGFMSGTDPRMNDDTTGLSLVFSIEDERVYKITDEGRVPITVEYSWPDTATFKCNGQERTVLVNDNLPSPEQFNGTADEFAEKFGHGWYLPKNLQKIKAFAERFRKERDLPASEKNTQLDASHADLAKKQNTFKSKPDSQFRVEPFEPHINVDELLKRCLGEGPNNFEIERYLGDSSKE